MEWTKQFAINAVLTLTSIAVVLVCAELVLRQTPYVGLIKTGGEPPEYYVTTGPAGYDIKPNVATTTHVFADSKYDIWANNLGCFDYPYSGGKNILLVGDSFAWGYTPFPDKWGTLLEKDLGKRILKCGVSGYGTAQEYLKTLEILKKVHRPDMLIVEHFGNDTSDDKSFVSIMSASTTAEERAASAAKTQAMADVYCSPTMPSHPLIQKVKCYFRKNSVLYLLTRDAIQSLASKTFSSIAGIHDAPPYIPSSDDIARHDQNILSFKNLTNPKGIKLLFVVVPSKVSVQAATSSDIADKASPEVQDKTVVKYLEANHIDYIYPLDEMRAMEHATSSSLYWRFDGHLSPTGNHFLSLLVAEHILTKTGSSTALLQIEKQLKSEFSYPLSARE